MQCDIVYEGVKTLQPVYKGVLEKEIQEWRRIMPVHTDKWAHDYMYCRIVTNANKYEHM